MIRHALYRIANRCLYAREAGYEGPTADDPMQGRTWCLTKIAELRE